MAIKKSTWWILITILIIFLVLLLIGIVGGLIAFSNKSFSTNVSVNNNMPEIPVNNNISNEYNNRFNNTFDNDYIINIEIDDEIAERIAEEVLEIIENETAIDANTAKQLVKGKGQIQGKLLKLPGNRSFSCLILFQIGVAVPSWSQHQLYVVVQPPVWVVEASSRSRRISRP